MKRNKRKKKETSNAMGYGIIGFKWENKGGGERVRVYECVLIPSREEGLEAFIKTQTDNALTLPLLLLMVSQSRVDSFSHVNPTTAFTLFPCKKNLFPSPQCNIILVLFYDIDVETDRTHEDEILSYIIRWENKGGGERVRVYECVLIPSREEGLEAFIKTQTDNALTLPLLLLMVSQSRVDSFSHLFPSPQCNIILVLFYDIDVETDRTHEDEILSYIIRLRVMGDGMAS
ncbi:hypothetical protein CFP56_014473 [Quercus suber]|uniref:Uncharacterized protein n=1 Tax=Quercus suber TaxID=58331 RepID=A0AAW0M2B9_QUESU